MGALPEENNHVLPPVEHIDVNSEGGGVVYAKI